MTDGEKVVQKRRFTQKDFANEILSGQSLHIARVPKDTKTWFKTLAAKDFNDDYGLTLTYLHARYDDLRVIISILDTQVSMDGRLMEIENYLMQPDDAPKPQEEANIKRTFSGRILKPINAKNNNIDEKKEVTEK